MLIKTQHRKRFVLLFAALGCLFCTACSSDSDVDKRLVAAYTDVLVARYSLGDSTKAGSVSDSVARAHGYTPEEMQGKLRSMANNYKLMKAFYDSVTVRLDSLRKAAMDSERR